ncbi:hypothetical protein Lal_00042329 [Lupinus albus]|nr:hypothetical protein Lal_00042329 [Lupinus albus]
MFGIASSSSRLLAYGIFVSRIIDHMEIDTSDVEVNLTNSHDHLLGEYLIHKMGIYLMEQSTAQPEVSQASHAPPFGLAHLDELEQRLNQRMDSGFQLLNDSIDSGLIFVYDRVAADIQREADLTKDQFDKIVFMLQTMSSGSNPPPSNKPS